MPKTASDTPSQRPERVNQGVQLRSYRWTFLVSGLEQENFVRAIRDLSETGLERVRATASALS